MIHFPFRRWPKRGPPSESTKDVALGETGDAEIVRPASRTPFMKDVERTPKVKRKSTLETPNASLAMPVSSRAKSSSNRGSLTKAIAPNHRPSRRIEPDPPKRFGARAEVERTHHERGVAGA